MALWRRTVKQAPGLRWLYRAYQHVLCAGLNVALDISVRRFRPGQNFSSRAICSVPTVNTVGDAMLHYLYTRLLTEEHQRPVYCCSPRVFPSDVYLPMWFGTEAYEYYAEPLYAALVRRFPRMERYLAHAVLERLRRRLDAFAFYVDGYRAADDPVYHLASKRRSPAFMKKYAEIRRRDNRLEAFQDMMRLLLQRPPLGPQDLPGFDTRQQQALLKTLGINRPYVCLHVREYADSGPYAWSAEQETDPRGVQCWERFLPALHALAERGYQIVRMGTATDPVWTADIPRFVDYAHSGSQSLVHDFYLAQRCAFFVGSKSGAECLAAVFRRPLLGTNYTCLNAIWGVPELRFVPKSVVGKDGRKLTAKELLDHPVFFAQDAATYNAYGLRTEDVGPEGLLAAVREFCACVEDPRTDWCQRSRLQEEFFRQVGPEHLDLYYAQGAPLNCYLEATSAAAEVT